MMKKGVGWRENIMVSRGYIKMGAKWLSKKLRKNNFLIRQ